MAAFWSWRYRWSCGGLAAAMGEQKGWSLYCDFRCARQSEWGLWLSVQSGFAACWRRHGQFCQRGRSLFVPTVSTDKSDYAPGTPVKMTGTGFQPFETVDLHLHEWVNQSTEDDPDASVTLMPLAISVIAICTKHQGPGRKIPSADVGCGYEARRLVALLHFIDKPISHHRTHTVCGAIYFAGIQWWILRNDLSL